MTCCCCCSTACACCSSSSDVQAPITAPAINAAPANSIALNSLRPFKLGNLIWLPCPFLTSASGTKATSLMADYTHAQSSTTKRASPDLQLLSLRFRYIEVEQTCGVQPENLGPFAVVEITHRALDRSRRVRPRTLVVRVIVGPEQVVDQVVLASQVNPGPSSWNEPKQCAR